MAYERRSFSEIAVDTTLTTGINDTDVSFTIDDYSGWPTGGAGKFFARIESETVLVTLNTTGTMTGVSRAQNGTTAAAHVSGVAVTHVFTIKDADEANYAVNEMVGKVTAQGDILYADGANSFERLPKGTAGQYLKQGATIPAWASQASTDISDFAEAVADTAGAMFTGNTETGITVTYQDADNTVDLAVDDEYISDLVGTMVTGNTETGIAVTYQDADNTLDFVVGVDDSTVEISSGNLRVKDAGITAAKLVSTIKATPSTSSSWVPALRQNGSTITKTVTQARYIQVGCLVTAQCTLAVTSAGTTNTTIDLTLPVAHTGTGSTVAGGVYFLHSPSTSHVGAGVLLAADTARVVADFSTLVPSVSAFANGDVISFTLSYFTA